MIKEGSLKYNYCEFRRLLIIINRIMYRRVRRAVRFPDFFLLPVRFPDFLVQIIFYGRDEGDLGLGEAIIILTGKSRDSGFGTGSWKKVRISHHSLARRVSVCI